MKTLILTSPYLTGPDVVRAQAALKRGNIFKADYLQGPQDGVFGEGTARACIRAKYWLGYSEASIEPIYGDQVHAYLTGSKPLGPIMKIRRDRRLKAAQEKSIGERALEYALHELGYMESPRGSNQTKYGIWYGVNGVAWCAIFASYCLSKGAGSKFRYAYCPFVVNDARAGRNGLQVVSYADARPGDLALYNWDGDWDADHIGFLEEKAGEHAFHAVEGNTGIGNDSNGGQVMRRWRKVSQVQAFVRVGA